MQVLLFKGITIDSCKNLIELLKKKNSVLIDSDSSFVLSMASPVRRKFFFKFNKAEPNDSFTSLIQDKDNMIHRFYHRLPMANGGHRLEIYRCALLGDTREGDIFNKTCIEHANGSKSPTKVIINGVVTYPKTGMRI